MSAWPAKCWDWLLVMYGRGLPYFPGKWRITEALAHKAAAAWKFPRLVRRRGILFELDPTDLVQRSVYYLGVYEVWETRFLERVVKRGWIVADVGANIGYYTLILARLVGREGFVLAFEPAQSRYSALMRNMALNEVANVHAFRAALADQSGQCSLIQPSRGNLGNFRLARQDEKGEESVPLTTLDQVIEGRHLGRLDVIKVDIEGAEHRFLVGAKESIARFRPMIMIELNSAALAQFGATPKQVVTFLEAYGYRLYRPSWKGFLPLAELPGPNDYFNVIALKSSSPA